MGDSPGGVGGSGESPGAAGTLVSGQTTVATAGTAVLLLAAATETKTIIIKALHGNTNNVYIGNVSDDVSSSDGFVLDAGEALSMDVNNESVAIYVDSDTNGEGVSWIYLN